MVTLSLLLMLVITSSFLIYCYKTEDINEKCEAISNDLNRIFNVCVLPKNHIGAHLTVDGMVF